jgi:transposase
MKASGGQQDRKKQPDVMEFVPKHELDRAKQQIEEQQREIERLRQQNERLRNELEAALRAGKRQAAPHSRGRLKAKSKRPGRKPGRNYGKQACRPTPSRVDETIRVSLPEQCAHCGGGVEFQCTAAQYQEEIVRRTIVRRFDVDLGKCRCCGRRVQGRHPLQTSDAVEVGTVQLGPEALALAAILNKQMGLSLGHTQQVLAYGFGLKVSCGGLYRALARLARRAQPTYAGLVQAARQAAVNVPDETGWKVGGRLQWMHVAVSAQVTVYAILPGRGYKQSEVILGEHYQGFLVHDGWVPYYQFAEACHQSCLRHLLVRCTEMARIASPSAAVFPLTIHDLLQAGLRLRDRYQQGEISEHGLRSATGRLEVQLDQLLEKSYRDPANRRLAKHLRHEQPYLFTFLHCPGLDATNHEAERAVRWMVIARKVWGGNRTWAGAQTQQILVSLMRTCWQQDQDPFAYLILLLRSPDTQMLDIVPAAAQAAALLELKAEPCP